MNNKPRIILIVEDDLKTSKLYLHKLTSLGYEVIATPSGQQGLVHAKEKRPSLIILDIMLPGKLNGFDVLENLKSDADLKSIPVIILTNLDSEREVAMKIGAKDYFIKANTSFEDVVNRINELLGVKTK
jgi:DNA-binding response OmpR family regulator